MMHKMYAVRIFILKWSDNITIQRNTFLKVEREIVCWFTFILKYFLRMFKIQFIYYKWIYYLVFKVQPIKFMKKKINYFTTNFTHKLYTPQRFDIIFEKYPYISLTIHLKRPSSFICWYRIKIILQFLGNTFYENVVLKVLRTMYIIKNVTTLSSKNKKHEESIIRKYLS